MAKIMKWGRRHYVVNRPRANLAADFASLPLKRDVKQIGEIAVTHFLFTFQTKKVIF